MLNAAKAIMPFYPQLQSDLVLAGIFLHDMGKTDELSYDMAFGYTDAGQLLGHGKHFLGPVLAMSPIMLPIEIVSNLARLLSLTVRLWVNMFVSETLYVLFLGLMLEMYLFLGHLGKVGYVSAIIPLLGPVPFILLHIFVAVLQAFVFTILPVIYVAGAVGEEH
jgi:F-type H+-transporting ATPase subunit a